ncbi:signal peptidase I [Mesonia hippocampi]|uniref:Signal peptidase I n=1 Tax=Mesonia hippocampi TaxID=1628250 RepID=A0A840EVN8_9FLAO|nr:signal peptidase I [Mesonia hippocampi]MBB4119586.1 signal peptidase I [Mesonia hippocampi]
MTFLQWFIFFLAIQGIHFLGTWKLYKKAGRQAWEALIPVYNAVILMKIINRPKWWVILLFIPIINLIMFPVIWVETIRSFGKNSTADTWLTILSLGLYIYYVNYATDANYISERSLKPKSEVGEWVSSILFAVVVATIVHTYFIQPFTIPTSSLEKTLLIGDFLFVSKFHYGARAPQTAVAFPMVHDTIPVAGVKSYTNWPQIPYFRLPGFQEVKRNDIVVFNWPVDTVRMFFDTSGKHYKKPIDKKSNYVKRAVGVPGDSLKIIDGKIHINNKPLVLPERAKPQYSYIVEGKGQGFDLRALAKRYNITDPVGWYDRNKRLYYFKSISDESLNLFKNHPNVGSITRFIQPKGEKDARIFPNDNRHNWNGDNFGNIYIPEKGKTVNITLDSYSYYKRIIEVYEGDEMGIDRKLSIKGNQVLLNGEPITSYTFKQNYYFMMGDNRHNSEDSRYWGYVPENHIVGKPVLIWMSWDANASGMDKIRWERLFTTVGGEGKPVSYFYYVLIAIIGFFGIRYIIRKKKKA